MTKEQFNRYCAEVMEYEIRYIENIEFLFDKNATKPFTTFLSYNPADNLNQMAEVFDKLWLKHQSAWFANDIGTNGIKQAMRDFIESTNSE